MNLLSLRILMSKILKNERGYAIIEVVLLTAVIAILSSIVLPKVNEGFKSVYADYLMKSLYIELRFMQSASRINSYSTDDVFKVYKPFKTFRARSSNENRNYRVRIGDSNEPVRIYHLRPNFNFERDFSFTTSPKGTLSDSRSSSSNSNHVKLQFDSKVCGSIIVFDSVGRIRFENPNAVK